MKSNPTAPIYIQTTEELCHEILIEALDEGDQIMSTTKYATTYRINPATVAETFTALVDKDLLVEERDIRVFVAAGTHERLRTTGRARFIQDSPLPVAEETLAFGLTPDNLIDAVHTYTQNAETYTKEH